MIQLNNLGLQLGTKSLLNNANLTIFPGQKWGVIGVNGSGKSSLFKLLLGHLHADSGEVKIPKDWRLAHMAQEVANSERTALDYILDGDTQYRAIEAAIAQCEQGEQLAALYHQFETLDGYTAPARAARLLSGLGFQPLDAQRSVSDFSGGWRIRLNLAQALMCPSDLLLLDEPTNHLDLDATFWLEAWLQAYKGTLLMISHDRDFLDNCVQAIASFEGQQLISYSGNYSAFERQKAERLAQQNIAFHKQQERMAEIADFVRRFRAKASKAKQAQSRLKELERMEKLAPAHSDSEFSFRFPNPEREVQTLLTLAEASLGYSQAVVTKVQASLFGSSRIGLLGHNGAGKSTLLKSLAGALPLLAGERTESPHLRIGYFAQHQLEALDIHASAALHLQRISPKASEQSIRNFLGSFGFIGERALETIEHFSGGEKARLALAIVAWQKPNLLLLDEPTNHLDLEVRQALNDALSAFEGAIVVVSHDRHLLRNTLDEFWLVADGKVSAFEGDLDDYHQWLIAERKAADEPAANKAVDGKKEIRQNAAARREQLKPLTQAIRSAEKKMDLLQKNIQEKETLLADPALYQQDPAKAQRTAQEVQKLRAELTCCEESWLASQEELERLNAPDT
ncbi:MAG TPA: ATP-binding cassette domain-containing protein [Cellvibrionaceae bacterium]|nr:ATP-binding cassette domain-containing protein [Cellvibrionaceae bacterium]